MMRGLLLFAGISLAASKEVDHVQCSINAAQAVDEMLDSAIFIWAATERCGKPGHEVNCEVDIAYAIESVQAMINVIVRAVEDCGGIKTNKCGQATGVLIQAASGMGGAAGSVVDKCPYLLDANSTMGAGKVHGLIQRPLGRVGSCLVNAKDAMRSLLKAVNRIMHADQVCKKDKASCAAGSMHIIGAFASIGQYLSAAIGRCGPTHIKGIDDKDRECSTQILAATHHISSFASAAISMSVHCEETHARLYELGQSAQTPVVSKLSPVTMALVALLPITGMLSYRGGKRLAKSQEQDPDFGVLQEMDF